MKNLWWLERSVQLYIFYDWKREVFLVLGNQVDRYCCFEQMINITSFPRPAVEKSHSFGMPLAFMIPFRLGSVL